MSEEYKFGFTIETEHARTLQWILELVHREVVPKLAAELATGRWQLGLEPEATAQEVVGVFEQFRSFCASRIVEAGDAVTVLCIFDERAAKILRCVFDVIGTDVVPAVAEAVGEGANELLRVWLLIWSLADIRLPKVDGTFDVEDLEVAWELGIE